MSSVITPGGARFQRTLRQAEFVNQLFQRLETDDVIGLVTPTAFGELVHVAISAVMKLNGSNQKPRMSGREMYKTNPGLIATMRPMLRSLSSLLAANRIAFVSPDELGPMSSAGSFDEQLVDLCCAYSLDTGDAQILLEARRLGVDGTTFVSLPLNEPVELEFEKLDTCDTAKGIVIVSLLNATTPSNLYYAPSVRLITLDEFDEPDSWHLNGTLSGSEAGRVAANSFPIRFIGRCA